MSVRFTLRAAIRLEYRRGTIAFTAKRSVALPRIAVGSVEMPADRAHRRRSESCAGRSRSVFICPPADDGRVGLVTAYLADEEVLERVPKAGTVPVNSDPAVVLFRSCIRSDRTITERQRVPPCSFRQRDFTDLNRGALAMNCCFSARVRSGV